MMASRIALLLAVAALATPQAVAEAPPPPAPMSVVEAAVLGVVEGLTEFLPVSSTGHLILAQRAMGIGGENGGKEAADAYAICIQLGAILAVLGVYRNEIRRMLAGLAGRDADGRRLAVNLVAGFLPAAVVGLTLGASTCYDGLKHGPLLLQTYGAGPMLAGFIFAFASAMLAVRWMVSYLKQHGLAIFGYYRVAIAVVTSGLILAGVLG